MAPSTHVMSWPGRNLGSYDANSLISTTFDTRTRAQIRKDADATRSEVDYLLRRHEPVHDSLSIFVESLAVDLHKLGKVQEARKLFREAARCDRAIEARHLKNDKLARAAVMAHHAAVCYELAGDEKMARKARERERAYWSGHKEKRCAVNKQAGDHALFQEILSWSAQNRTDMNGLMAFLAGKYAFSAQLSEADIDGVAAKVEKNVSDEIRLGSSAFGNGDAILGMAHFSRAIGNLALLGEAKAAETLCGQLAGLLEAAAAHKSAGDRVTILTHSMLYYTKAGRNTDASRVSAKAASLGIWIH